MPRKTIYDTQTEGLCVRVNWRRHDDPESSPGDPGYVQISTHNEREDALALELLEQAAWLMAAGGEDTSAEDGEKICETRREWQARLEKFRSELTGTYVTLEPATMRSLLRTLHKSNMQAWDAAERARHVRFQVPADTEDRDPAAGDPVLVHGTIQSIIEGVATVEVYRSWPLHGRIAVQCGALEYDERVARAGGQAAADEIPGPR
jgi:hypothetical protein